MVESVSADELIGTLNALGVHSFASAQDKFLAGGESVVHF